MIPIEHMGKLRHIESNVQGLPADLCQSSNLSVDSLLYT